MSINNKNKARVDLGNPIEIAEGKKTQKDAKFSRSYVSTINGAPVTKHPDKFDRPADPRRKLALARVHEYMNHDEKRTNDWMEYFNNPQYG